MTNNNNLILSGRYELLKSLGQGQSGKVFLARQLSLELNRAIKVIPKTSALSLFALSEAAILRAVQHSGIPTIYDFEEDESFYYLVEEYIPGDTLEEFLLHQPSVSQNLFFKFCDQLCEIFAYLHSLCPSPVLYRDLKPEHIIVCGLQIKLIDFSAASFIASSGNDFSTFGNVEFSAPELASGETVTLASDIYSIGKILEFMIPYLDAATIRNVQPIIQKATQTDPGLRYQTVSELSTALKKANDNKGGTHLRQTIAVIGSYSGCGCTHIAVSLTCALNHLGIDTVYREMNTSGHLHKAMKLVSAVWKREGYYCHKCFKGYPGYNEDIEIPEPDAEIIVEDYGCSYNCRRLVSADKILYVCGGALWHRGDARPEGFLLKQLGKHINFIVNLCDRNSAIYFARKFSVPVYPYPFDTNIFSTDKKKLDFVHWLNFRKENGKKNMKTRRRSVHLQKNKNISRGISFLHGEK